ncbi:hypothetical protein ACOMHN_041995 [Nucella lapillus]
MSGAPQPNKTPGTKQLPSFGFGPGALKKFPELIPIVGVVAVVLSGGLWFIAHNLLKKQDISILRGNGCVKTEWEAVKPTDHRKLIVVHPDMYKPIREVEDMKREIGSFKR